MYVPCDCTDIVFWIVWHVCLWPGVKENIRAVGNLEKIIVTFVLSRSINSRCWISKRTQFRSIPREAVRTQYLQNGWRLWAQLELITLRPLRQCPVLLTKYVSCRKIEQGWGYIHRSRRPVFKGRSQNVEKRLWVSCSSVWDDLVPTGRIFMKLIFECFSKICREYPTSFISDKDNGHFTWSTRVHL